MVDFLTYVFIPAFVVVASGLLPAVWRSRCAIAIIICGALYFADTQMKTKDNYFLGFPAVWNVPAFYLLLLGPIRGSRPRQSSPLAAATFLPVPFVHPFRVRRLRVVTIACWPSGRCWRRSRCGAT